MKKPYFQLVASFITMMMIGNLQYTWTLFVEPIRDGRHWGQADIQGAYTLFIILQACFQPMSGWFIDKLGQRPFITAAALLCGIGWSAMGHATSLSELYVFYAMAGVGASFVYGGSIGSALKWFPHRRGFASGVIAAGYGGGAALSVWGMQHLIHDYSYQTAFLVSGVFQGVVIGVIAQVLRHPGPDFVPPKSAAFAVTAKAKPAGENFTTVEMLRTRQFYILYFMFVAMGVGGVFITSSSGSLARSWGLTSALTIATTLGLMANAASRPFWGWIADRKGRESTMVVAFLLQAVFLLSVVTLGRTSGLMFTLTLFLTYFTWGEIYSLFPATIGDYFGTKFVTSNNSFLYSGKGVAAVIGIYLPAIIFQRFGSWTAALYGSAILALLSAVTALAMRGVSRPTKVSEPAFAPAK